MENANKALLIAASVLIGVMLLSIAVYLFSIFGGLSSEISSQLNEKEINEFNAKFYQYEGKKCRAHDIVSVANMAKENNAQYEYTNTDSVAPYYIIVSVKGMGSGNDHFEQKTKEEHAEFMKSYSIVDGTIDPIYFECTEVVINENTKLVKSITFEKIDKKIK